jgi:putative colanic acid biosysnthesis UDP-glucose lipid carrier transferase
MVIVLHLGFETPARQKEIHGSFILHRCLDDWEQRMTSKISWIESHFLVLVERPLFLHIADVLWIGLGFVVASISRNQLWRWDQLVIWAIGTLIFLIFATLSGLYRPLGDKSPSFRLGGLWGGWSIAVFGVLFYLFITKSTALFSRISLTLWFGLVPVVLTAWHGGIALFLRMVRANGDHIRRAAIVGLGELSSGLAHTVREKPWMGIDLMGFYEDRDLSRFDSIDSRLGPHLGDFNDLLRRASAGEIDMVFITLPFRAELRIYELINRLSDTTVSVYIAHNFAGFNLLPQNALPKWTRVGNIPVLGIVESPFQGRQGAIKQIEDLLLGVLILGIVALPMVIIALAVKLTSRGPIFFQQTRYGLNGERIVVWKFRTMTVCENGDAVVQARKNDDRITRVGAFLRRTSLDELPQFFHVITGKMSIVGPRPHAAKHNEVYRRVINHYMVRHKVKPGITGWAQVNGWRGETDTREKMKKRVEYDLLYIRNWSLLFDLKIILMTIFNPNTHRNVY